MLLKHSLTVAATDEIPIHSYQERYIEESMQLD